MIIFELNNRTPRKKNKFEKKERHKSQSREEKNNIKKTNSKEGIKSRKDKKFKFMGEF